jgi:hypothetical protein
MTTLAQSPEVLGNRDFLDFGERWGDHVDPIVHLLKKVAILKGEHMSNPKT